MDLATGKSDLPAGLKDNPTPTALSGTSPKSDIICIPCQPGILYPAADFLFIVQITLAKFLFEHHFFRPDETSIDQDHKDGYH